MPLVTAVVSGDGDCEGDGGDYDDFDDDLDDDAKPGIVTCHRNGDGNDGCDGFRICPVIFRSWVHIRLTQWEKRRNEMNTW